MSKFVPVTRERFYAVINPLNVTGTLSGSWPYVTHMEMPDRTEIGRSQDAQEYDRETGTHLRNYWLREDLAAN